FTSYHNHRRTNSQRPLESRHERHRLRRCIVFLDDKRLPPSAAEIPKACSDAATPPMNHLPKSALPFLFAAVCSACAANGSPDAKAPTDTMNQVREPAPEEKPRASSVRVATREHAGRTLEILDES